ncbi:MAG: 2-succinyl-6-hydroxy-2,4-cyclohexadiene-1-carboxylate synthase [Armatimonadota bacterium]|nr:2-succinyl-6-hydroxy-2,4-cyclohexadiene-1-carboxylate synthase [Armatimonadota bacterium]MDR7519912.1 2-succinyl-6-hydroxy-2,4-cyclohexadiene-1-carboxylate synthase [Armatimonadota bacterium]MDR7548508.1 2-succinyl-6-hydroxy-2,4-cyclohexadiene-1-carboxylate synthase [Armatimonadota bacterium]
MPRLVIDGVGINVETAGSGPPLVLLHGFTGSAAGWAAEAEAFASRHLTISVDLLGHGLSDAPPDPSRYRLGSCIEDVLGVLDRLGIPRAGLLGYSMGGRVALGVAIAAPERLSALILESASPGLRDPQARRERAARDAALAAEIERDGIEAFVARWEQHPLFASQARLAGDVWAALRDRRLRNSPVGLANSLRGLGVGAQPPMHDFLPDIRVPTLLVAGALDPQYCALGREMAARIPGAQLEIVPDAGHAVHLEQPLAFRRLVLEFLAKVGQITQ